MISKNFGKIFWLMQKTTRVDVKQIAKVFANRPKIIAVWLFGSAQKGVLKPGSDLDLGVLFSSPPTLYQLADLRADLQQALQIDEIDLVTLNNASPILRFEAVSGRSVFCRDTAQKAAFVSLTAREYEDAMAFLQRGLTMTRGQGDKEKG